MKDATNSLYTLRRHLAALILFPALSFVWVGDTLIGSHDLSAFDIVFRLPHWKAAHEYRGVQEMILSDSPQAHYPERALKWGAARNGHLIDFNPYIFSGIPDQAQGPGGFVTSPFQLFMEVSEAIDWSTWFRLAAAGLFLYAFLIVLGLSPWAAILGGVIWVFNFHQMVWLEFPQHLATQLWIPAILCFNYGILRWGLSWERVLGLVVTNALFFTSGYTMIVLYTYIALGLFNTAYLVADGQKTAAERASRWLSIHAVWVLSALLLLPKVLVDVEAINEGLRGQQDWLLKAPGLDWNIQTLLTTVKNSLPDIADYKRFFSANYFGGIWGEDYFGREHFGNIVHASAYSSVVMLLLAPISLRWLGQADRRPFLLASCVVLMFAFGMIHGDRLIINAFQLVPMSGYGGHDRYLTVITLFLSILAAIGLHSLMKLEIRTSYKVFWAIFALLITSPLWMQLPDPSINLRRMQYPVAVLLATGVAAATLYYFRLWRHLPIVMVIAVAVDLLVVTYGFNPRMEDQRNFPTTPTIELLLDDQTAYRTAEVSTRQLYPPNILQYYAIPSIGGYWTVVPNRYLRFIDSTIDDYHFTNNGQLFFFDINYEVFRLLNVKYLMSENKLDDERLRLAREAPGYWVYELADALPRAYCASDIARFSSERALLDQFDETAKSYDRPMAVVSEAGGSTPLTEQCEVSGIKARLNGVDFTVDAAEDTFVLVPYNHLKGWRARTADRSLDVRRANYNFIAIPVDAGSHTIELTYHEDLIGVFSYVMIGLGLTVLGWFLASGRRTGASWFLVVLGTVLVFYTLLELPAVSNNQVPERLERRAVLPANM